MGQTRLDSRSTLWRVYGSVFISSIGLGAYSYFVPVYAERVGAGYADLGLLAVAGGLGYAIAPYMVGYLADRLRKINILLLGLIANAAVPILFIFTNNVLQVILARAASGVAFAFFWPAAEILISLMTPSEARVTAMGRYSMAWATGMLIGPFIAGKLIEDYGYPALFSISALTVLAGAFPILFVKPPFAGDSPRPGLKGEGHGLNLMSFMPMAFLVLPYSAVFGVFVGILPGHLSRLGLSPSSIGTLFTAFGISRIASFYLSGRLSRMGARRLLGLAFVFLFMAQLIVWGAGEMLSFTVSVIITGFALGIIFPVTISLTSEKFQPHRIGLAVGLYESVFGTGFMAGPLIAGLVAEAAGPPYAFFVSALLSIVALLALAKWRP